jgi:hypothetical protein
MAMAKHMSKKMFFTLFIGASLVIAAPLWSSEADAQVLQGRVRTASCAPSPFLYDDDPFWGPGPYPYSAAYPDGACLSGKVRVLATPEEAAVYVDGFYAGLVDDFDGALQRLPITPGDHAITLYLEGYRTVTRHISVAPDASVKLRLRMDKLGPDQTSELPPLTFAHACNLDVSYGWQAHAKVVRRSFSEGGLQFKLRSPEHLVPPASSQETGQETASMVALVVRS